MKIRRENILDLMLNSMNSLIDFTNARHITSSKTYSCAIFNNIDMYFNWNEAKPIQQIMYTHSIKLID